MQWIYIRDHSDAYKFDLLITNAQVEFERDSGRFTDYKDQIKDRISGFSSVMHLTQVQQKASLIKRNFVFRILGKNRCRPL